MKLTRPKQLVRTLCVAALALGVAIAYSSTATATLVVAGDLQDEHGDPSDWTPSTSSLLMTDNGGVHTVTVNNLVDGAFYEFKVLDDEGTPPADWGDPEIVPVNTMAFGDSDGSIEISVDTNNTNINGNAVVWVNTDNAQLQVVGSFMDEAGGAGDWNNDDALFDMTPLGGGMYVYNAIISTPGSYEFKAVPGTGTWDYQVGTDGFNQNAGTFAFSTTVADEAVTLYVDVAGQQIGVNPVPEPASLALVGLSALGLMVWRRR